MFQAIRERLRPGARPATERQPAATKPQPKPPEHIAAE
jgi:hypothetical protein